MQHTATVGQVEKKALPFMHERHAPISSTPSYGATPCSRTNQGCTHPIITASGAWQNVHATCSSNHCNKQCKPHQHTCIQPLHHLLAGDASSVRQIGEGGKLSCCDGCDGGLSQLQPATDTSCPLELLLRDCRAAAHREHAERPPCWLRSCSTCSPARTGSRPCC